MGGNRRRWWTRLLPLATLLVVCLPAAFAETRFQRAQQLAWNGEREAARELCRQILADSPDYHDVRILMARTFAWDRSYGSARGELHRVLLNRPSYIDAYRALADTELWDRRYPEALAVADVGLRFAPQDLELRYRKVLALERLEREPEAHELAKELHREDPGDARFTRTEHRLMRKTRRWAATVGYRYEDFNQFSEPWEEYRVALKYGARWGSLLGRVRQARRFGDRGEQLELDAYPRLPGRMYAYLNLGLGEDPFPRLRAGAEVFANFAGGWEGSLGGRYLDFSSSQVPIYTGSISKYISDYWIALRPVVTDKDAGVSQSWGLTVRRYFGEDTWVGGTFSFGSKPDPDLVDAGGSLTGNERLESGRYGVQGSWQRDMWRLQANLGFRQQDVGTSEDRESLVFSVGLTRQF